jgi:hypothetical protein
LFCELFVQIVNGKPHSRSKKFREDENIGIEGEDEYIYEEEEEEDEEEEEIRDTQAIRNNTRGGKHGCIINLEKRTNKNQKEDIKDFINSQKRISNIRSVLNEKEIRLADVEGKPQSKKSTKRKSGSSNSKAETTIKEPSKRNNLEQVVEESPDRISNFDFNQ